MERRKEPRVPVSQRATITILGSNSYKLPAVIENRSQSGVALRTQQPIPLSAPVRVDAGDRMLLGEVCHCAQDDGSGFVVGLQVEHVLGNLASLARLNRAIERECPPRSDDREVDRRPQTAPNQRE